MPCLLLCHFLLEEVNCYVIGGKSTKKITDTTTYLTLLY